MAVFCFGEHKINLGERTRIMGILNVTPDSFSDGGKFFSPENAVAHALDMVRSGADIIDIGGQSTRPGHAPVSWEEEWERLEPVLNALKPKIAVPISVDTYYPEVAVRAVEAGASIINDVSGSLENGMIQVAVTTGAGLIMMHSGGGSDDTGNGDDTIEVVRKYFTTALEKAKRCGLPFERICLDPGIGFGKDRAGDLKLVSQLPKLLKGLPQTAVLVGASRKRVIASCCDSDTTASKRVAGTIAMHTIAVWNGAHILRVHDVAEGVQAVRVTDALRAFSNK
jgi:dihydropteroate synthase